jgi:hypothetical protein
MRYVIRLVGLTSGEPSEDEARYVCRLKERAGGGRDFLATTSDPGRALAFETADEAFEFWHSGAASGFHAVIEARRSLAV